MNKSVRSLTLALTLAAAALFGVATAQGQTTITYLPYTITTKGLYVLGNDINSTQTSGNLITINASNVTIDFQGHYIAGPVGNTNQTAVGIYAFEQSNLTIKNGTIAYCNQGIAIYGNGTSTTNSVDQQIDNMRVTYGYFTGITVYNSPATRITNCQVSQCGYNGSTSSYGISVIGGGTTVLGNVISSVYGTNGQGISVNSGSFVRQNTIFNCIYGVNGGKYQDNLTSGCSTPYTGGIDAGGNN